MSRKLNDFVRRRLSESAAAGETLRADIGAEKRARYAHAVGKDTLYRYRSLSGEQRNYALDIITNRRVYLSSPVHFNDPFDCAPAFVLGGDPNDPEFVKKLLRHQEELRRKLPPEEQERVISTQRVDVNQLASALEETIRGTLVGMLRVLCVSSEHLHPLCWSHYASNHTGICLHFSTKVKSIFRGAAQVLYQKERSPIVIDGGPPGDDAYDKSALTKAEFWSYEDEYRIVTMRDGPMSDQFDGDGYIRFPAEALCGITLGMHISDSDRDLILQMARMSSPQIPVWRAKMHPKEFWMVEDRIE
jgi:hypothetical protein